jgi:hypothetical protein
MSSDQLPLISAGAVVTLVTLLIALLKSFQVPISADQEILILKIVAFVAPWLVVWWGHHKTTPLAAPKSKDGEDLVRISGNPTPASKKVTRSLSGE